MKLLSITQSFWQSDCQSGRALFSFAATTTIVNWITLPSFGRSYIKREQFSGEKDHTANMTKGRRALARELLPYLMAGQPRQSK